MQKHRAIINKNSGDPRATPMTKHIHIRVACMEAPIARCQQPTKGPGTCLSSCPTPSSSACSRKKFLAWILNQQALSTLASFAPCCRSSCCCRCRRPAGCLVLAPCLPLALLSTEPDHLAPRALVQSQTRLLAPCQVGAASVAAADASPAQEARQSRRGEQELLHWQISTASHSSAL